MTQPIIHPGELLAEEFLKPCGVSAGDLAEELKVPHDRITAIIAGKRSVCVDIGLRLSRFFGTSDRFWLEAQLTYDLERARRGPCRIASEVQPLSSV